jgi:hypothetical protein
MEPLFDPVVVNRLGDVLTSTQGYYHVRMHDFASPYIGFAFIRGVLCFVLSDAAHALSNIMGVLVR